MRRLSPNAARGHGMWMWHGASARPRGRILAVRQLESNRRGPASAGVEPERPRISWNRTGEAPHQLESNRRPRISWSRNGGPASAGIEQEAPHQLESNRRPRISWNRTGGPASAGSEPEVVASAGVEPEVVHEPEVEPRSFPNLKVFTEAPSHPPRRYPGWLQPDAMQANLFSSLRNGASSHSSVHAHG